MLGHKLNGFTITDILADVDKAGEAVIVACRYGDETGMPLEYVTGRVATDHLPEEWYSGHYFMVRTNTTEWTRGTETHKEAIQDALRRSGHIR